MTDPAKVKAKILKSTAEKKPYKVKMPSKERVCFC
jgi:hypothetical protein